ncbi:MFS transporter [Nocardia puris]|uniref:MFS transporter n=1 Tax=Nocardia puris TaxID=208602 RepID=A0A366DR56_9NOCA|nr:MFS transporter [Nocardia puris]MBF6214221.1 MFS transporter [Nocardia puris]MBF6365289.1 MFS transporter [Nocardia puris]MBF6459691.1 MFS transporter [Nocardia puris]RBO91764.1 MFS transporter [Nocardia puris]
MLRAILFKGSRELIPLYALYALLFADHGLSTAQISSLLAIWSVTAFVLEVPSGAWADTVSRRLLLILSGALVCAAFVLWTATPSYLGFALGFVLWGVSGALESGTFEALIYDGLAAEDATAEYPRIMGYAGAAEEVTVVVAILAAAPLYAVGGYALVGWVSVAVAAAHTLVAASLPSAPKAGSVEDVDEDGHEITTPGHVPAPTVVEHTGVLHRYLAMLRAGIGESMRVRRVRYGVLLGALLFGITAYDEYFGLLAQEAGVATALVPVLVGVTVLGSLTGTLLAGRTSALSARTLAIAVAAGGVLFIGGALVAGAAAAHPGLVYPLTGLGFTAIGVGYGVVLNAEIVTDARLQDAIAGPARATVTSVSGFLSEILALGIFGFAALATQWFSMAVTLALLGSLMFAIAALMPRWLPPRVVEHESVE